MSSRQTIHRNLDSLLNALRCLRRPHLRAELLTRLLYRDRHFQGSTTTLPDRFPELFAKCAVHLANAPSARVLSFGCADGEELVSLRKYMPTAHLIGVDLNRWCLRQAAQRNLGANVQLLHTHSRAYAELAELDAIFAMAVLQRSENRLNQQGIGRGFTFSVFNAELTRLDRKLKPGGLFIIDHADFSFAMASIAGRYRPLPFAGNATLRTRPLYGPQNTVISRSHTLPRMFLKLRDDDCASTESTRATV